MSDDTHDFDPRTGAYVKPDNADDPVPADASDGNGDGGGETDDGEEG